MNFPAISKTPEVQKAYEAMRLKGEGHALAEMLALGSPPMSNTDREFLQGHSNGNQFEKQPWMGDALARDARAAGVDPKGKVYLSGLAAYPGDPRAWVSGRGDVRAVCEERGWGAEGSVNLPVRKVAERTGGGIARDIVDALVERELENDPGADARDVRGAVVREAAPNWAKREV